jgi:hypothetical protein
VTATWRVRTVTGEILTLKSQEDNVEEVMQVFDDAFRKAAPNLLQKCTHRRMGVDQPATWKR